MDIVSTRIAVLNSLVFMKDRDSRELPTIDGNGAVWSIPSCVAVSCRPDCDGETLIRLVALDEIGDMETLLFDGSLTLPSGIFTVVNVLGETVVSTRLFRRTVQIKIWTNGRRDTDKVIVGVK